MKVSSLEDLGATIRAQFTISGLTDVERATVYTEDRDIATTTLSMSERIISGAIFTSAACYQSASVGARPPLSLSRSC